MTDRKRTRNAYELAKAGEVGVRALKWNWEHRVSIAGAVAGAVLGFAVVAVGAFAFAGENSEPNVSQLSECERLLREYRQGLRLIPKDVTPEYEQMNTCIRLVIDNRQER